MTKKEKKFGGGDRPLCLVTGSSAGIGAAIATEFAAAGWNLALTARRRAPMLGLSKTLNEHYGTKSHIITADLAAPGASEEIFDKIAKKGLAVDGVVNNAGYGLTGNFDENEWQAHQDFLMVMLQAPTQLAHLAVPGMKERGFGRILNVASLAGLVPGSRGHTLYAAVKSYLIKMSQSMNLELAEHGINVSALCPGFTKSEFHDANGTRGSVSKLPKFMWQTAEEVAEAGFMALEKNRAVYVPGSTNKLLAILPRMLPDSLGLAIMRKNSERVRKG